VIAVVNDRVQEIKRMLASAPTRTGSTETATPCS
jgi:hypothetical protein